MVDIFLFKPFGKLYTTFLHVIPKIVLMIFWSINHFWLVQFWLTKTQCKIKLFTWQTNGSQSYRAKNTNSDEKICLSNLIFAKLSSSWPV